MNDQRLAGDDEPRPDPGLLWGPADRAVWEGILDAQPDDDQVAAWLADRTEPAPGGPPEAVRDVHQAYSTWLEGL